MRTTFYIIFLISLTNCTKVKTLDISDCWLLFSVERLDYLDSNPNKTIYYSQSLRESNSTTIGKDWDYQKWSWKDSCLIEYSIKLNGEKYSEFDNSAYELVNDTIIYKWDTNSVAKYGINIDEEQLILTGYANTELHGISNFQYIFNLIEE